MIQSNQLGNIYYTKLIGKNTTSGIYTEEMTITNNTKLHIYTKHITTSKTIEYTIQNQTQNIINFSYTIKIPIQYISHDIRYNTYMDNNIIRINTSDPEYYSMTNKFISFEDDTIINTTETTINQPGILITFGDTIDITYYNYTYGNITKINVVYSSMIPNLLDVRLFVNYKSLPFINIYSYNQQPETFETILKSNANMVKKNETISFMPRYAIGCDEYELLQTYIITNEIITPQILNQTIEEIEEDQYNHDNFLIVPQYRTVIEAMNTLMLCHINSDDMSRRLNLTYSFNEETLCMAGIESNRMNYIHFTNPLQGILLLNDTSDYSKMFYMYLSMNSYQNAKFSLNLIQLDIASTSVDEILGLIKINFSLNYLFNNETKSIYLYSPTTNNVTVFLDTNTFVFWSIITINGFEYIGAFTEEILENTNNYLINNMDRGQLSPCLEKNLFDNYTNNSKNLLNLEIGSNEAAIEDFVGSLFIEAGYLAFTSSVIDGPIGLAASALLLLAGNFLVMDANGFLTDPTNISRIINTGISLIFSYETPIKLSKYIPNVFRLVSDTKILEGSGTILHVTNIVFNQFERIQDELLDYVEEEIISEEAKEYVIPYLERNIGCKGVW